MHAYIIYMHIYTLCELINIYTHICTCQKKFLLTAIILLLQLYANLPNRIRISNDFLKYEIQLF